MTREPLPQALTGQLEQFGLAKLPREQALLIRYETGEYLSYENVELDYIQFIIKGQVKVSVSSDEGKTLLLCFDTVGDMIGSIELFGGMPATATAQCIEPTEVIAVPTAANLPFFSEDLDFLRYLCYDLSTAFALSSKNSAVKILYPLQRRLCSYLIMMEKDGYFQDKLVDMAELLGTSYRHLLRELNQLCQDGIIRKEGRGYRLLRHDVLEELGGGYYFSPSRSREAKNPSTPRSLA